MTKVSHWLLGAALLGAALLAAGAANAASMTGNTFDLSFVGDDLNGGTFSLGPFSGVAGVADDIFGAPDLLARPTDPNNNDYEIRVNWVDGQRFDLFFFGPPIDWTQLAITVSGLQFKTGNLVAPIDGASFNRADSNVDSFFAGPQMPNPSVSFTSSSITASFGFFPAGLSADGPTLRFEIHTAPVPEPGALALMLAGLAGVGLLRQRRGRGAP